MTRSGLKLFACVIFLAALAAKAQTITGTTNVDIDPSTNIVTITCETDLDMDSVAYYEAEVGCTLTDGSGTQLAYGSSVDDWDDGFAQVVLTYQGVPGGIYNGTGAHSALIIFSTDDDDEDYGGNPGFEGLGFDDIYNFAAVTQFIDMGYGTMPFDFSFQAPGPDTETHKKTIPTIYTTDTDSIPTTTATLTVNFTGTIDQDDGASYYYVPGVGTTNLGTIVGSFLNGPQRCQSGNESVGTLSNSNQQSSYTVKRTLLGQTCWTGSNGDVLVWCAGGVASGSDDTGTWIETLPANSKVFNLDTPGLPSVAQSSNIGKARQQFAINVVDSNNASISQTVKYYNVISCKYPAGQSGTTLSTGVTGDNQGVTGKTNLSWNLQ